MRLEKEVEEKKFQHENRIRILKTQFLREQRSFEEEAEMKVNAMAEKADKVCKTFMKVYYLHSFSSLEQIDNERLYKQNLIKN